MSKNETKIDTRFIENLQLIFIAFKLANLINWSWWWVLSPIWITLVGALLFLFVFLLAARILPTK